MDTIDWAPLLRLQAQHAAARDQRTRDGLEDAMSRMVDALHRQRPRTGTLDTARANQRRKERRRVELERLWIPLMAAANDPWPELDRRLARDRAMTPLAPGTRAIIEMVSRGYTYREAGAGTGTPVGTVKSRVSRFLKAIAA